MAPDVPPPAPGFTSSRPLGAVPGQSRGPGQVRPNVMTQTQAPAGVLVRPPLVSREIDREVRSHADPVVLQVSFVSPPPSAISRREPTGAIDHTLPRKRVEPGVCDPANLARPSGVTGQEGELPVGHDLPPRNASQDLIHALSERGARHSPFRDVRHLRKIPHSPGVVPRSAS